MATVTPVNSSIRLGFETGVDGKGNPLITTRTFNQIKSSALDQDLYDIAYAMASLLEYPLVTLRRVDNSEITA